MKKILITGGSGFIGSYLARYLLAMNYQVRVLIRNAKIKEFFPKEIECFVGDLTQADSLQGVCTDIDTVFHLAGYAHAFSDHTASMHHQVNFEGTKSLFLQAQLSHVKRFIFFSSVKAVGEGAKLIDENWQKMPTSPYGLAKRAAETFILSNNANPKMHTCILRLSLVYGPGWKGNLANMLEAIKRGFFPPLPELNHYHSMISIEDVCHAAVLVANHPKANGQIYFLTDNVNYTTRIIYNWMREALGKKVPKWYIPFYVFKTLAYFGDWTEKLIRRRMPLNSEILSKLFSPAFYSSKRIQDELGFKPSQDLKKILSMIVNQPPHCASKKVL